MHKSLKNLLQRLWERHTAAGQEFIRFKKREAKFTDRTRLDVQNMLDELDKKGFHLNGTEPVGSLLMHTLTSTDDEIHVFTHRDKGDLYGVFRQVRNTDLAQIVKLLTEPTSMHLLSVRLDVIVRNAIATKADGGFDAVIDEIKDVIAALRD